MIQYNSIEEFSEHVDPEVMLEIQYHVNVALEQIRQDSLQKSNEGKAKANISMSIHEDQFLIIEFNFSWNNGSFSDDEQVKIILLNLDEWLDFYSLHKDQFKTLKAE